MSAVALTFEEARACVVERVSRALGAIETEEVELLEAAGRVLAEPVEADRDYPPTARSVRDGFAVRAEDLPGPLRVVGEVRAGETFGGEVGVGECVEIMTGAPMPRGADAVVMVEHVTREGDRITADRRLQAGENFNPQGGEARAGAVMLVPGVRIDYAGVGLLATVGKERVRVYRRPRVAMVATGDEVVGVGESPRADQVRNSNSYSVAAQVKRAGGEPWILPVAPDEYARTRELIEQALEADLVLLSGGVSAGKYDLVEQVLGDLGAEFYFTRVRIQPGQPLVFGRVKGKFFFGLPGNPASTMVTFEVFGRAALELLSGEQEVRLPLLEAKLAAPFAQKAGLTRFLPAVLSADGATLEPVKWKGSGDVPSLARANCYLVSDPERERYEAGERIRVLRK